MDTRSTTHEAIVVGAGPAGIATALALKDRGVRPLVLDKAEQAGSSWRSRYDRLRLNTSRFTSHLPDRRFPKGTPIFPTRDQVVAYLEHHAAEPGMDWQLGTEVERIEPDGDWLIETSAGQVRTRQVVVATGYEGTPLIPDWSGRNRFEGSMLHSREYKNPEPFRGRRVLVVGPGCSGMEIAYDLAEGGAGKVWLSARTPPNIVLKQGPGPLPGEFIATAAMRLPPRVGDAVANFGRRMDFGDLSDYGLPVPEEGVFSRLRRLGVAPAILDKEMIEAIKAGRIEVVRGVEALEEHTVELADGAEIEPDVVICATGYRSGLEPLVGHLGVLDERGVPRSLGERAALPGLRFVGYVPRPGAIGYMGKEAKRAAKAIARELRSSKARSGAPARQPVAAGG